jgi:hypothetical protein
MQTADFDVNDFNSREAGDKSVYVKFYIKPVLNETKTDEEGRPIYDDKEYIEIRTPGNTTNIVVRPVSDMDRKRFRLAYQEFKSGETEQTGGGTPLIEAPWITRSQVEELSYLRIRTLEQLAAVGDDVCTRIPGLYKLKERAKMMAERAEKAAPFMKIQAENDEMRNRLETLEKTIADQAGLIASLKKGK